MGDPLVAESVRRYFDNDTGYRTSTRRSTLLAPRRAYPDPAVRRQWLDRWISLAVLSHGHRALMHIATGRALGGNDELRRSDRMRLRAATDAR